MHICVYIYMYQLFISKNFFFLSWTAKDCNLDKQGIANAMNKPNKIIYS